MSLGQLTHFYNAGGEKWHEGFNQMVRNDYRVKNKKRKNIYIPCLLELEAGDFQSSEEVC